MRIEAAGWRIIDLGDAFELEPARPPDVIEDGRTTYGSFESVPSRLAEAEGDWATVIVIAGADQAVRTLPALAMHSPAGTQVVVVCGRDSVVDGPADEVIRTAGPFSPGEALMAGLRRASGAVVVVMDAALEAVAESHQPAHGRPGGPRGRHRRRGRSAFGRSAPLWTGGDGRRHRRALRLLRIPPGRHHRPPAHRRSPVSA